MPGRSKSAQIALCGIFGALAIVVMSMGSIIPFATYVAPATAGILLIPIAVEFGLHTGVLAYVAVGLLSLLIAPDKEMALMFVFFLGFYPLAKAKLDCIRSKIVQLIFKFALFNACIAAMYGIILFVFPIAAVVAEFTEAAPWMLAALLLVGNATFAIYDSALARIIGVYVAVWRKKLLRMH